MKMVDIKELTDARSEFLDVLFLILRGKRERKIQKMKWMNKNKRIKRKQPRLRWLHERSSRDLEQKEAQRTKQWKQISW